MSRAAKPDPRDPQRDRVYAWEAAVAWIEAGARVHRPAPGYDADAATADVVACWVAFGGDPATAPRVVVRRRAPRGSSYDPRRRRITLSRRHLNRWAVVHEAAHAVTVRVAERTTGRPRAYRSHGAQFTWVVASLWGRVLGVGTGGDDPRWRRWARVARVRIAADPAARASLVPAPENDAQPPEARVSGDPTSVSVRGVAGGFRF